MMTDEAQRRSLLSLPPDLRPGTEKCQAQVFTTGPTVLWWMLPPPQTEDRYAFACEGVNPLHCSFFLKGERGDPRPHIPLVREASQLGGGARRPGCFEVQAEGLSEANNRGSQGAVSTPLRLMLAWVSADLSGKVPFHMLALLSCS